MLDDLEKLLLILTLDQWKALGFMLSIVSAVTETVKRVFLVGMLSTRRRQYVYAVAFLTGFASGMIGWGMVGTTAVPDYYWLTFGIIVGPAANFLHWISLGIVAWKWPELAQSLKGHKR
jgi:hypothetical protein